MTFPHYFHIFGHQIHPHLLMELIAYTGGFQIYLRFRKRWPRAAIGVEENLWIIVGAIFGAVLGSKILAWVESAPDYWPHRYEPAVILGGKTIVGGLLGGWAGVEIAKRVLGVRHSTGDAFVFPLIFGMAVGRIGCFLTGVADHTHGNPSSLPWAVDEGDGIPRHPAQLYDIVFLSILAIVLGLYCYLHKKRPSDARIDSRRERAPARAGILRESGALMESGASPESGASLSLVPGVNQSDETVLSYAPPSAHRTFPNGRLFRLFLLAYLLWRFSVEFIKPRYTYFGLSAIQMACAVGAILLLILFSRPKREEGRI